MNFLAVYPTLLFLLTAVSPRLAHWPRLLSAALVGRLMGTLLTDVAIPVLNQLLAGFLHPLLIPLLEVPCLHHSSSAAH